MILKNWTSICENYNIWCKKQNKPLLHINLRVDASEEKKMSEPEDLATAYVQSRTQRDERLGEKNISAMSYGPTSSGLPYV